MPLRLTDYVRAIPDFPKPGILFRDITPPLASGEAFRQTIHDLAHYSRDKNLQVVAVAERRGFLIGGAVAVALREGL